MVLPEFDYSDPELTASRVRARRKLLPKAFYRLPRSGFATLGPRACPDCTYPDAGTVGCETCNHTGHARTWRVEAVGEGAHWHIVLWMGRPGSRANCGTFILDSHDFEQLCADVGRLPNWEIDARVAGLP